ncbi:Hypothetical predicted protein, partial [Marmota monax]
LTLEGGRSRDAHHRRRPHAARLRPRPGCLTGAAAGPEGAEPTNTSSAVVAAAVRPRATPPPCWPRPASGHAPAARSPPPDQRTRKPGLKTYSR